MEHASHAMMDIFLLKSYVPTDLYPQQIHIVSAIKMGSAVNAQKASICLTIPAIWSIPYVKPLTILPFYANSAILVSA